MNQFMRWLYKLPLAVVILFLSCIGSFGWNIISTQLTHNYYTTDNIIYQSIKQKSANEWYSQASIQNALVFKTDTRFYYAEAYANDRTPDLVFINIGTERDGLSGSEGFLYLLPDQTIPQYWLDHYWIT